MLSITPETRDKIIDHALSEFPNEACGLFAAEKGTTEVDTFFPMHNIAQSNLIYQLDPKEMIAVEMKADALGIQIIGVMHSHTASAAEPSETDVHDASQFDPFGLWHYIIVSLEHEEPAIRSFRIINETVTEEVIEIK
ncbi:MAG: M67 family metallopeptidase [Actinomycetota bacterium]|nr:M67 family metallopeptidase [Actinomycetota bacterium]